MKSFLVRNFGFPATLIHGDTLVLDRWRWLKQRLPLTAQSLKLIDVGCGTGAFTIGAALRGYAAVGLSWDERNHQTATERATLCKARSARFEVVDVRKLDERKDLIGHFDIAICLEVIEHILNDDKLLQDIARCLKPNGRLLLTTPYYYYRPITKRDAGPFSAVEDGWHVRKGYTKERLEELCMQAGLSLSYYSFCSGLISQKVTFLFRTLSRIHPLLGWGVILPLRVLPPLFDPIIDRFISWPQYSICLEARKSTV